MQLADNAKFPLQPEQIFNQTYGKMEKCGIWKYKCREWLKKYEVDQTWYKFKTHFTEAYFELKEHN